MRGNKLRLAILISGGGTTMEAIIKATRIGRLSYVEVACVISSRRDAAGINKARKYLPHRDVCVLRPKDYPSREFFGEDLIKVLKHRCIDFISMNGYMVQLPANVVDEFDGAGCNQHPGPLRPRQLDFGGQDMYGARVHSARLDFVRQTDRNFWTEAVCQRIGKAYDTGAVVKLEQVPIRDDDTVEKLKDRVLPAEHDVQIEALHDFSLSREQEVVFDKHDPLVRRGEENILAWAKARAIEQYPKG